MRHSFVVSVLDGDVFSFALTMRLLFNPIIIDRSGKWACNSSLYYNLDAEPRPAVTHGALAVKFPAVVLGRRGARKNTSSI